MPGHFHLFAQTVTEHGSNGTGQGQLVGSGSGIGVKNVNERIHLYFGKNYGLSIESEPDEGTTVRIHLPAIAYEEAVGKEEKHA